MQFCELQLRDIAESYEVTDMPLAFVPGLDALFTIPILQKAYLVLQSIPKA
jgi:hypothetical protein